MNFRTSHLAGFIASILVVFASPSASLSAAEPLKITGPDGESHQTIRQYGPTNAADTFWSIAQKVRPDNSVTVYQVMAAIYEANPHAFSRDNYNSLEKGMILLIPTKAEIAAIPKSLAKQQAEYNDRGWVQGQNSRVVAKPVAKPAPAQIDPEAETMPLKVSVATQKQIEELTAKLEAQQATNLSLTDELARAQDKLNLSATDIEVFQSKIDELNGRIGELDEALLVQKEQKAALSKEVIQLREQIEQLKKSASNDSMPTAFWRNLMENPLYLALAVSIPGLLLLVILWAFFRRRNEVKEVITPAAEPHPGPAPVVVAPSVEAESVRATDEEELMAVHLDTDDENETLDSVIANDEFNSAAFIADENNSFNQSFDEQDEGQSLDDLWAEAMGEQDDLSRKEDAEDELSSELDLDELLKPENEQDQDKAEFESPEPQADLDALWADLDDKELQGSATEEIDSQLEQQEQPQEVPDTIEEVHGLPFEDEPAEYQPQSDALPEEQTLIRSVDEESDSLLAELERVTTENSQPGSLVSDLRDDTDEDIVAQLDAELELLSDPAEEDADLDALLASFGLNDQLSVAKEHESEPENEPDADLLPEHLGAGKAPLEFESFAIDDANHEIDPVSINLDQEVEDSALDSLLADLQAAEKQDKEAKGESGFFNDLKGKKSASDNSLDWDDSSISFSLADEVSADEALAALKTDEQKQATVATHDLSAFQQDNGFIDIDKLLNEADEEGGDADQYKELDIDMGELNDLMSNAAMVDVDDEENSVNAKLDLARAYIEIDDKDSASALLKEVELDGNVRQQEEAKLLLKEL